MTLHRKDITDRKDPNPDKDQAYQQPEMKEERIEGRSFADTNFAADERQQRESRRPRPDGRGNRSDDVQLSDRSPLGAAAEGQTGDDRAERVEAARSQLDFERREETGQND